MEEVVGVWRDYQTGQRLVAVVWADNNHDGGSWIDFEDLQLPDTPPEVERAYDEDDAHTAFAIPGAEDTGMGDTILWHDNFGKNLGEGLGLVVEWADGSGKGTVFRNFRGQLSGDFDSGTSSHQITYAKLPRNNDLHTSANSKEDSHYMNLATLEVDNLSDSNAFEDLESVDPAEGPDPHTRQAEYFGFWVKESAVNLPFVAKHLFSKTEPRKQGRQASRQGRKLQKDASKKAAVVNEEEEEYNEEEEYAPIARTSRGKTSKLQQDASKKAAVVNEEEEEYAPIARTSRGKTSRGNAKKKQHTTTVTRATRGQKRKVKLIEDISRLMEE
jgi:hypothetical protein